MTGRHRMWSFLRGRRHVRPGGPELLKWTPDLVDRFWSGQLQTRLEELSFSRAAGQLIVRALQHHLAPGTVCLDFGAGSGHLLEHLLQQGVQVAAWEPSSGRQAELLTRFAERPGFLGLHTPRSRRQFDVVFAVEVLEHVLDSELDRTLRMLSACVAPGGLLVVTTPNNEDLELGMCYCPVSNMLFHRWQHVRAFTADSLEHLLGRYGIRTLVTHLVEFRADLFAPLEHAASEIEQAGLPDYLLGLRTDTAVRMGAQNSILSLGRRASEPGRTV